MPFDDPGYLARYEAPPDSPYVAKLLVARNLLENGWIQNEVARGINPKPDADHDPEFGPSYISYDSGHCEGATQFCSIGAMQCAWGDEDYGTNSERVSPDRLVLGFANGEEDLILGAETDENGDYVEYEQWSEIPEWNDDSRTTIETVLDVFDRAIAFARAKGL